jgi:diketogulonate reductase-like aldo/keto reductase
MQQIKLNNGVEMPILGFGVFQIADEKECEAAVTHALEVGYRLIDTAASYLNERAVGRAIKASGIPRNELFITTKLWLEDAGEKKTSTAFHKSLEKLQLDHLDLYLIHQPFGDYYGSWRAMENLNASGVARAIGVANFYGDRLTDLVLHNEVKPAINQIETHPYFQRVEDQAKMELMGIQIESWGPFAEARNEIFTNKLLSEIAQSHNKSVAQVILRWLTHRGVIVIPKSVRPERMRENIDIFDFSLTEAEMETIKTLDTGSSLFFDHRTAEAAEWLGTRKLDL